MKLFASISCVLLSFCLVFGQSVSFKTYMNPVIPGDHPDCTLTKVGNDFYTTGSSFNPTPVIYHSTDLVHWEAVAQPVSAAWSKYDDAPAGGCWGGQVVYYQNKWWDFFSRANQMYFVAADSVKGPWSMPTLMNTPSEVPGLGYDNSIFIDNDSTWYLLVKNGQVNNWVVQLGNDGQPQGRVLNLTWLNPSPSFPYSWAEGPVMWKHDGYYYYCFAHDVSGGQYVMRSKTLTDSESAWTKPVDFFNLNDPQKSTAVFNNPNHASAVVMLSDSTYWVLHPLWRNGNNNEWYGQGRQGLLNEVHYDTSDIPIADYPVNIPKPAPNLPSSGIPWMVPHTDFFSSTSLNPEWSFLGYTPANTYSLTDRPGWLMLSPKGKPNTIIKNDGEHNYSLITRVDFNPQISDDQAGLWLFNGLQTLYLKLYSTIDSAGDKVVELSFKDNHYLSLDTTETPVWLKLVRVDHQMTGYWSNDGFNWAKIGSFDVTELDGLQPNWNSWTGNRQGLFVQNKSAYFDFYIYRDAYTSILAECPANQLGTTNLILRGNITVLNNIYNNNWAMYAGVEFGNDDYQKNADSIKVVASSATDGGTVEVYIDSIDASTKIAECNVTGTGSWTNFKTFSAKLTSKISGHHDVYLLFSGSATNQLFMLRSFYFTTNNLPTGISGRNLEGSNSPRKYELEQNYPNPFNPSTNIKFTLPSENNVKVTVFNQLGQQVAVIADKEYSAGTHNVNFNAENLASGVYYYTISARSFRDSKKMILLK
jgi:beta-xylosidase